MTELWGALLFTLKNNVFLVHRQLIYNYPEQLFAQAGVMAIEHADFAGVERLALVTGTYTEISSLSTWCQTVWSSFTFAVNKTTDPTSLFFSYIPHSLLLSCDLIKVCFCSTRLISRFVFSPGGEITSTFDHPELVKLGHCNLIEQVMIGEDTLIHFSGVAMGTHTKPRSPVIWGSLQLKLVFNLWPSSSPPQARRAPSSCEEPLSRFWTRPSVHCTTPCVC